jgi:hypothetical protein
VTNAQSAVKVEVSNQESEEQMSFNICMENFLRPFPLKDRRRVKSDPRYIKSLKARDYGKSQRIAAKILLEN